MSRVNDPGYGDLTRAGQGSPPVLASGSQTLFRMVGLCWSRPGLLLVELCWRWLCGAFLLLLTGLAAQKIASMTLPAIESTGLFSQTLESAIQDPTQISVAFTSALAILHPYVLRSAEGLAPLALFAWASAFALGRTALLRRYDSTLPSRPWLLAMCEALRLLVLLAASAFWYAALGWAARYALGSPTGAPGSAATQGEPNLFLYSALVICISIGLAALWSLLSWALVAAPLIALLERTSFARGFARSLRARAARGRFVEVNLAMGIIKLGLVVLAMVLSSTPLPFESVVQGWPLYAWWGLVTLLYLAASDFFKLARLFAFLEFWAKAPGRGA